MITPSLCAEGLTFGRRGPLFSPLDFACRPGETWAVLGANGRGKSTLIETLGGALAPQSGKVDARGGVSVVPQFFRPAFSWQVQDVVLMGRARHISLFAQPTAADAQRVANALAQLEIAELAAEPFIQLSGGQQQLVMIARSLVSGSQNILLDEPCSALDLANQQRVLQLIDNLAWRQQRSVLFTTHDPTHAAQIASHVLLLLPDSQWLAGERDSVMTEASLERAYGLPMRKVSLEDRDAPLLVPLFRLRR